jgi:hypothetical protein
MLQASGGQCRRAIPVDECIAIAYAQEANNTIEGVVIEALDKFLLGWQDRRREKQMRGKLINKRIAF